MDLAVPENMRKLDSSDYITVKKITNILQCPSLAFTFQTKQKAEDKFRKG